ncbi:MAG TPA: FAD-dependent monooxygenase [Steroidobacteraceae bacterium]|jgi:2-polyprenyl-6-methoxyphenol hydroxylase-like FAD-dependent oxidoreductase
MKAVICGAGIAGLALAARLSQAGWAVALVESAPAPRSEGYMIDLFGSGYEAASRTNLLTDLEDLQYRFAGVRWLNEAGRQQAHLGWRVLENLLDGRLMTLMRSDLEQAVLKQLTSSVTLRFDCTVTQVLTPVGAVEVYLSSGEVERADVLIGADGVHSRVRDLVFGDGASWFRFMGFHTAACVIDAPQIHAGLGNEIHIVSAPGRQVALYPLRDGLVATSFVHRAANSAPPYSAMAALETAYGDLGWKVPEVLRRVEALPSVLYEQMGQVVMAHWCRGRIALLGDACQATTFLPGQGASLSLAAAYVLGEELCTGTDVKASLMRYEHRVRPPLIHIRRSGRRAADWLVPASNTGLVARNGLIRLASRPGLARLLRPVVEAAREDILSIADAGRPHPSATLQ